MLSVAALVSYPKFRKLSQEAHTVSIAKKEGTKKEETENQDRQLGRGGNGRGRGEGENKGLTHLELI